MRPRGAASELDSDAIKSPARQDVTNLFSSVTWVALAALLIGLQRVAVIHEEAGEQKVTVCGWVLLALFAALVCVGRTFRQAEPC